MKLKLIGVGIAAIAFISVSAAAEPTAEEPAPKPVASQPADPPAPKSADPPAPKSADPPAPKSADPPAPKSANSKPADSPAPKSADSKPADSPAPKSADAPAPKSADSPAPKSADSKPADPPSSGPVFGPVAMTGVAFVGAGIVIGAVAGGITLSRKMELREVCTIGDGDDCPSAYHDERMTAFNTAHVSTAGFILAGIGAVTGLVGLFAADKPTESKVALTPLLGPGQVGIRGSF